MGNTGEMTGRSEARSSSTDWSRHGKRLKSRSRVYIYIRLPKPCHVFAMATSQSVQKLPLLEGWWIELVVTQNKREQMVFKMTCLHLSVCTSQRWRIHTDAVYPAATVTDINASSFFITHMIRSKISDCLGTFTDAPVWIPFQTPNIHHHWHTCPVQNKSTKQQWWLFMQMLWQSFSHLEVLLTVDLHLATCDGQIGGYFTDCLSLIFKANDCI